MTLDMGMSVAVCEFMDPEIFFDAILALYGTMCEDEIEMMEGEEYGND